MAGYEKVFQREEKKYLLTDRQFERLQPFLSKYMAPGEYADSKIYNLYFDTQDHLLIRRSMDKPVYKEKLRLRAYQIPKDDTGVFLEIKKKYDGIVYKRRIGLRYRQIMDAFEKGKSLPFDQQISREIEYMRRLYPDLMPRVMIYYERMAYSDPDGSDLRITFDTNILWRDHDLDLQKGVYGNSLLRAGEVLMELKSRNGLPMWLAHFLSSEKIYPTSFSKYASAYQQILNGHRMQKSYFGGVRCA